MKNNRQVVPTKFLPRGAKRITNQSGERVWLINGMEFVSKAEYFQWRKDQALAAKLAVTNAAAEPVETEPISE